MQTIVLLATLVAAALAIPSETYDAKYDNVNTQEILENDRLLGSYVKCFIGEGACVKEAADYKGKIHEALETNCRKCTPKQRQHIRTVVQAIKERFPDSWAKLQIQQDPKGEYKKSFEAFLNADD